MTTLNQLIETGLALEEKATPGPWKRGDSDIRGKDFSWQIWTKDNPKFDRWVCNIKLGEAPVEIDPTADLIVFSRNNLRPISLALRLATEALDLIIEEGELGGSGNDADIAIQAKEKIQALLPNQTEEKME